MLRYIIVVGWFGRLAVMSLLVFDLDSVDFFHSFGHLVSLVFLFLDFAQGFCFLFFLLLLEIEEFLEQVGLRFLCDAEVFALRVLEFQRLLVCQMQDCDEAGLHGHSFRTLAE